MNREAAEEYTNALTESVSGDFRLLALAMYELRVPQALGMTPHEWRLRVGAGIALREDRAELSRELTAPPEDGGMGLSQRKAAEVLGVSQPTVLRDTADTNESERSTNEPATREYSPVADTNVSTPPHVANNAGDNEWYTPKEYIDAARTVMGGIDLDPASSKTANRRIKAKTFYTAESDGLAQPWFGRVWMNPPYAPPLIGKFATRIAREYTGNNIEQACVLVNNATETNWFQEMAAQAKAMCFPRGRVSFWHPDKIATPLQGQAVIYLGPAPDVFAKEFVRFGFVL
jgi:phage N-6-adenine-methyltransferase